MRTQVCKSPNCQNDFLPMTRGGRKKMFCCMKCKDNYYNMVKSGFVIMAKKNPELTKVAIEYAITGMPPDPEDSPQSITD